MRVHCAACAERPFVCVLKKWMDAMEEHSAYSTHYCSHEQGSEEEDDDDVISTTELSDSLQVTVRNFLSFSASQARLCAGEHGRSLFEVSAVRDCD